MFRFIQILVYTEEMLAILLALQCVDEVEPLTMVMCSDSSSSLQFTLQHSHSESRKYLYRNTVSSVQSSDEGPVSSAYMGTSTQYYSNLVLSNGE